VPNYSLNNDAPEPDRTLDNQGYTGLDVTNPQTFQHNAGGESPPGNIGHPLMNEVNVSSNTTLNELGPPAGDFARRGY